MASDIEILIDRSRDAARRAGACVELQGVVEAMRRAHDAGKDPLGIVEAVTLHVQARLQVLEAEIDADGGR